MDIEAANITAVERMMSARPMLTGIATARDVIPGMHDKLLLHAGPPIEWDRMSGPLRGAVIGALLFEGLAKDDAEAQELAANGEISFAPCHHHNTVGPMAGVTSASMAVYVVENSEGDNSAYSNLNEGYGKVLRYGAYSQEVIDKLKWMNDSMAPLHGKALESGDGIELRAL